MSELEVTPISTSGSVIKIYDQASEQWVPILVGRPGPTGPTGACCNGATGPESCGAGQTWNGTQCIVESINQNLPPVFTIEKILNMVVKTISEETSNYTLNTGDDERIIQMNVSTANQVTIPNDDDLEIPFYEGAKIDIVQTGAGQTSIVAGSGVVIYSRNDWKKINARYGKVTLIKKTTDEWFLFGDLSS
jgi:hypothetical protein